MKKTTSKRLKNKENKKEKSPNVKVVVNIFYNPVDELKKKMESSKIFVPILAGSSKNQISDDKWIKEHTIRDDSGDNLSDFNYLINEMTTIYWAWKHMDELGNPEYIGFNHYRRFFNEEDIIKAINDGADIICAKKYTLRNGVYNNYKIYHIEEDYKKLGEILAKKYGKINELDFYTSNFYDEYVNMSFGVFLFACNMFVMKKDLFDEYCKFIFPLLVELVHNIKVDNRDSYQKRAICFLGERLTSMWIMNKAHDMCRIKQLPIEFHPEWRV